MDYEQSINRERLRNRDFLRNHGFELLPYNLSLKLRKNNNSWYNITKML